MNFRTMVPATVRSYKGLELGVGTKQISTTRPSSLFLKVYLQARFLEREKPHLQRDDPNLASPARHPSNRPEAVCTVTGL